MAFLNGIFYNTLSFLGKGILKVSGLSKKRLELLFQEKAKLQQILDRADFGFDSTEMRTERELEIFDRVDELKKALLVYDEKLIRQMIECVRIISKEKAVIDTDGNLTDSTYSYTVTETSTFSGETLHKVKVRTFNIRSGAIAVEFPVDLETSPLYEDHDAYWAEFDFNR